LSTLLKVALRVDRVSLLLARVSLVLNGLKFAVVVPRAKADTAAVPSTKPALVPFTAICDEPLLSWHPMQKLSRLSRLAVVAVNEPLVAVRRVPGQATLTVAPLALSTSRRSTVLEPPSPP